MKDDDKIQHPFLIPDNFHEQFKSEIILAIQQKEESKTKSLVYKGYLKTTLKYAAIITIAFLMGRFSSRIEYHKNDMVYIETVYNQVSEDEILNFIIEDETLNDF